MAKEKNKTDKKRWDSPISVAAILVSIISLIGTTILGVATYNIQRDTYEAMAPFQKPIIYFSSGILKPSFDITDEGYRTQVDYTFFVKNFGKGIAKNTTITTFVFNFRRPDQIYSYKWTLANELYPDMNTSIPLVFAFNESVLEDGVTKYVIVIKSDFIDRVTEQSDSTMLWEIYIWNENIYHPSLEEKNYLEPYLKEYMDKNP